MMSDIEFYNTALLMYDGVYGTGISNVISYPYLEHPERYFGKSIGPSPRKDTSWRRARWCTYCETPRTDGKVKCPYCGAPYQDLD